MNKPIHYATARLKKYREDRNWTQEQLADFLSLQLGASISRSTIQKWEQRQRGIVAEQALDIAKVLQIPVMDLVIRRDA